MGINPKVLSLAQRFIERKPIEATNLMVETGPLTMIASLNGSTPDAIAKMGTKGESIIDQSNPGAELYDGVMVDISVPYCNVLSKEAVTNGSSYFDWTDPILFDRMTAGTYGQVYFANFGRAFGFTRGELMALEGLSLQRQMMRMEDSWNVFLANMRQAFEYELYFGKGIVSNPEGVDRYNSNITGAKPTKDQFEGILNYGLYRTSSTNFNYANIDVTNYTSWKPNYLTFGATANYFGYTSANVDTVAELLALSSVSGLPVILDIITQYCEATNFGAAGVNGSKNMGAIFVGEKMFEVISRAILRLQNGSGSYQSPYTNEVWDKLILARQVPQKLLWNGFPIIKMSSKYTAVDASIDNTGLVNKDTQFNFWPANKMLFLNTEDLKLVANKGANFEVTEGEEVKGVWGVKFSKVNFTGNVVIKNRHRQGIIDFPEALFA